VLAPDPHRNLRRNLCRSLCRSLLLLLPLGLSLVAEYAWREGAGYRFRPLPVGTEGRTGFTTLSPIDTGVSFTNTLSDTTAARNQVLLSGSGVALGDVDGDGWCDIYLCRLEGPNALYRNLGDWRFTEITESAGVACPDQYSTGAAFADVDGDGDLDLLVNGIGAGTRLFLNDGAGRFQESLDSGLSRQFGSICMALGDLNGDGAIDLYVANYRTTTVRSTGFDLIVSGGQRMIRPEDRDRLYVTPDGFIREYGEPDFCYLNDGKGRFRAMSWTDGTFLDEAGRPLREPPKDWSYSVAIRDLNGDGAPDIYVCGDFWSVDRCWINDGKGRFRALPRAALPCTSSFSMGLDIADINRDGHDDIFVLDMLSPVHQRRLVQTVLFGLQYQPIGFAPDRPEVGRNVLFLNRGDGSYAEIAYLAGLHATEWSWSPVFLDVDLDGYEDVLIPTGHGFDTQDVDAEERIRALGPWPRERVPFKVLVYPRLNLPNLAYRNHGDLTFKEMGRDWGFDLDGISQGTALADLDGDGDLDVVLNNMNSAASLVRNDGIAPRLAVKLEGKAPNTRGLGARIRVLGASVPQSQEIIAGGRFASSDEPMRVFAANDPTNRLTIEVTWRSGARSVVTNARPNHLYVVAEAGAQAAANSGAGKRSAPAVAPFFEDVSPRFDHRHHEEFFDDLARQPSLPLRLSQLGPGVSWFDIDGDGWDDLIVGSGRGGTLTALRNTRDGSFVPFTNAILSRPVTRDQTTVLAWKRPDGQTELLAGSANYEDGLPAGSVVRRYPLHQSVIDDSMPGAPSSVGPLALADYDGDGSLDLFVGGRVIPGRYPEAASSFLFRSSQGRLELDTANSTALAGVGIVSGAVWTDLTGDGWPELALACEWGPIRIYLNEKGRLREVTAAWGLEGYRGWWNGIAAGDFNGDGQMDLIVSNLGRNSRYEPYRQEQPIRIYHGDFYSSGVVNLLEAYFDPGLKQYVPWRSLESVGADLPMVREQFATHRAFAEANVDQVLGDLAGTARVIEAQWSESSVLLNRGNRFTVEPLPFEAQLAPAFGVCVSDFDGDGFEDVFLSQNLSAVHPEDSPMASGSGLWLRGDGDGRFTPVAAPESGIRVHGEQRGCATSDYDQDGRADLVITQNGYETRLFRNLRAKPGLRVRLAGSPENPTGVGAVIRLVYPEHRGPAREVHAGAGYWSQDSPVQVLGMNGSPTKVWVRWPGGRTTESAVPPGAREVRIDRDGGIVSMETGKVRIP
jgi:enediyne biosynthesis protein E4